MPVEEIGSATAELRAVDAPCDVFSGFDGGEDFTCPDAPRDGYAAFDRPAQRLDARVYKGHIASLDGLRAVAICLVFLHHYYPRQNGNLVSVLASAGWVGVDLFFVLSGFLITGILFDMVGGPKSLQNFLARRVLRLVPAYAVIVGLAVMLAGPLRLPLDWRDVPFFGYAANLSVAFRIDPPSFGPYLRFRHLWSLAVEEQFYLLWAPLVLVLARREKIMKACTLGIMVAIILRGVGAGHVRSEVLYQSLFTRMDSILCGSLLALGIRGVDGGAWLNRTRLQVRFGLGLLILGGAFVVSRSLFDQRMATQVVGFVGNDLWCTSLLGLALVSGGAVNRVLSHRALRFIGRYSYGIYLWHEVPGPVFDRLLLRVEQMFGPAWLSGALGCAALFGACLVLAMASYHAVELPFLHLKRYFSYETGRSLQAVPEKEEGVGLGAMEPTA